MASFVVFADSYDYHRYVLDDFHQRGDALIVEAYPFRIGGVAYRVWNALRTLLGRTENFPRFWFRRLLRRRSITPGHPVAFCITNTAFPFYSEEFVKWLRRTYPGCRVYMMCLDSIAMDYGEKTLQRASYCDAVFSFDKGDCEKYGWRHFWGLMPTKDRSWFRSAAFYGTELQKPEEMYDLCFIGGDRGRYPGLKELYVRLRAAGVKCMFRIKTEREAEDDVDRELMIRELIPFQDVLHIEGGASILLDYGFIPSGEVGFTLRVMDAVGFSSGIITNNRYMKDCPLAGSEKVGIIDSLDDITPEMIRRIEAARDVSYTCMDIFSADRIIESITEDFAQGAAM